MVGTMSRAVEVLRKMIKTKIILTYHLKEEILSNNIKISNLSNLSVRGLAQALAYLVRSFLKEMISDHNLDKEAGTCMVDQGA
jgi:hypothetical protein